MRAKVAIRFAALLLVLSLYAGCAHPLSGRVTDARGRAIPYAHVQGSGGVGGGFITGEGIHAVTAVADTNGRFTFPDADVIDLIIATSPDSKKHGRVVLSVPKQAVIIVVK